MNQAAIPDSVRLETALEQAVEQLWARCSPEGFWLGELSPSALSTATSISALALAGQCADQPRLEKALTWLAADINPDGGWGDTPESPSNISTTLVVYAALHLIPDTERTQTLRDAARPYVHQNAGTNSGEIVQAVSAVYGADRTFAVPILVNCALAGLVEWEAIPDLPYPLAVMPPGLLRALRLHVVSYALPALIGMGLVLDSRRTKRGIVTGLVRDAVEGKVLQRLQRLQPVNGGFLEAPPLTGFVAMSLLDRYDHTQPVAQKCLEFLRATQRDNGSWPIDTNLAVWLTTGAARALHLAGALPPERAALITRWILARQYDEMHVFTAARPGGWGWTHLPGAVPDADDTSGAICTLARLADSEEARNAQRRGVKWLVDLQNSDGGWPTFCRGWGHLPFDRSSPDITAHALRALFVTGMAPRHAGAVKAGFTYLARHQTEDGAWHPLWFGNQGAPGRHNPVLGTARVLLAYKAAEKEADPAAAGGVQYLLSSRNTDGGWGGAAGVSSSVEETALAVCALARWAGSDARVREAAWDGTRYLAERIEDGTWMQAAPIGLYFSSLWYSEQLYPLIWTVEALGSMKQYADG